MRKYYNLENNVQKSDIAGFGIYIVTMGQGL